MLGGSMKALLTAQELVAHMKKKGIGFTIVNEENAEDVGELAEQLADLDLGI